ncbi:MAG: MFS transporter [Desulforhopalus sp.]
MAGENQSPPAVRWLVLLLVMSGVFLSTMDSGMVNVALPTIMRSFHISLAHAEFVVTLYLLTITVTLVFWGRLAGRVGLGTIYLSGMALFAAGGLACYFSGSYEKLLASRFFQALGASMMMSSGPAIIKSAFPGAHLGRSLGLVGIATACGLLTGPFVSGLLISVASWRTIFVITLPVACIALVLGRFFLFDHLMPRKQQTVRGYDWKGSCCWVLLVILCLAVFHRLDSFLGPVNLLMLAGLGFLLLLFVRLEKVAADPILPIPLLTQPYYWIAVVTAGISFAALFSVLVLIPFYLEYISAIPVARVGRVMMAVPATLIVLSPVSGYLYDKIGARYLTTAGLSLSALSLLTLALLGEDSTVGEVAVKLAVLGAGQSVFLSPNSASVLSQVEERYASTSAGILATARNFGMVAGATLAAALFSWWFAFYTGGTSLAEYTAADSANFILALRTTFAITALMAFVGCFLSSRRQ